MDRIELTTGQKALLTLYNGPDFCVNLPFAFKIKGNLDKERLEQSLQKTINDNDVFRFQFEKDEETGKIYQYAVEQVTYKLEERKANGSTYEEKYEDVKKQVYDILAKAKGLFNRLMWDFVLFDMGNDTYIFFARINHLICDGVSIIATLGSIISNYNRVPFKKSLGFEEYIKEQAEFQKTEPYTDMFQKFEPLIESYKSYKPFIQLPEYNRKKTKETYFASVESGPLSEFCKNNRLSLFHISLFFYHAAISAVYQQKDTMIIVPIGTRKSSYTNTIGYLVSACYSRLILEDGKSMREAVVECRNHFLESSKTVPIFFDIYMENSFPHEFLLTYQNQVTNSNKRIPLGEAEIEKITDPGFNPQEVEMNVASMSGIENGDKIIYTLRADEDVFSADMKEKAGKAFVLAARCLAEKDMTFREFCEALDNM